MRLEQIAEAESPEQAREHAQLVVVCVLPRPPIYVRRIRFVAALNDTLDAEVTWRHRALAVIVFGLLVLTNGLIEDHIAGHNYLAHVGSSNLYALEPIA